MLSLKRQTKSITQQYLWNLLIDFSSVFTASWGLDHELDLLVWSCWASKAIDEPEFWVPKAQLLVRSSSPETKHSSIAFQQLTVGKNVPGRTLTYGWKTPYPLKHNPPIKQPQQLSNVSTLFPSRPLRASPSTCSLGTRHCSRTNSQVDEARIPNLSSWRLNGLKTLGLGCAFEKGGIFQKFRNECFGWLGN